MDLLAPSITSDPDTGDVLAITDVTQTAGTAVIFDLTDGVFSFDPTQLNNLGEGESAVLEFSYTVSDGTASTSSTISVSVDGRNDAPVVSAPIADAVTPEDALFSLATSTAFTDPDVPDVLTYSATLFSGDQLPGWLGINLATGELSGTPGNGDVGQLFVKVTATDPHGLSVDAGFQLTVENVNDTPTVTSIADIATQEGAFITIDTGLAFSDDDIVHGDSLSFAATLVGGGALPTWLSIDASSGLLQGTAPDDAAGILDVEITATDLLGASATTSFEIDIQNVTVGSSPDGYIQGGTIFADADEDGILDGGEASATTDADGDFLLVGGSGTLVLEGGTDISTDLPFEGRFLAPDGSTVITPVTTLIALVDNDPGTTTADAQTFVVNALGLPTGVDLTTFDQIAGTLSGDAGVASQGEVVSAVTIKLQNTAVQAAGVLVGVGAPDVSTSINAMYDEMASQILALGGSGFLDLADTAVIEGLINNVAATLAVDVSAVVSGTANVIAASNQQVDDALNGAATGEDLLTDLAQVAIVADDASTELETAGMTGDTSTAENDFTGANLDTAVTDAEALVEDVTGNKGTDGDDVLSADVATDPADDIFDGMAGDDQIAGLGGADTISGGTGADLLDGGSGDDSLLGNEDDDVLIGGDGADVLDGGTGFDTADYSQDAAAGGPGGVTVDLAAGTATDGFGASDTLSGIEAVVGTAAVDSLTGDTQSNRLQGNAGDDSLAGDDGIDTAVFNGNLADYTITTNPANVTVTDNVGTDGTDTTTDIERFEFADQTVSRPTDVALASNTVDENTPGAVVGAVTVTDPDAGDVHSFTVSVARFEVAGGNLKLKAGQSLDFETEPTVSIDVTASDPANLSVTKSFLLSVNDINDAPDVAAQAFSVDENQSAGATVGTVLASDSDIPPDTLSYTLTNDAGGRFSINSSSGVVSTTQSLDFEGDAASSYGLTVEVSDGTDVSSASLTVDVNDINDAPVVGDQTFSVNEESDAITSVGTVFASDQDLPPDTLSFTLLDDAGGLFTIDAGSGEISTAQSFDFETEATTYALVVEVSDGTVTDTANITVNVNDITEGNAAPMVNDQTFSLDENSSASASVGTVIATDADPGNPTFTLTDDAGGLFGIDNISGLLSATQTFDFESDPISFALTVEVTDGIDTDSATITVDINDINDAPVMGDQTLSVSENAAAITSVGTLIATDEDVPADTLTFDLTDDAGGRFSINTATGEISTTQTFNFEVDGSSFVLTATVEDDGLLLDPATVTVDILDENDAPVATAIGNQITAEDAAFNLDPSPSFTDQDSGDSLSFTVALVGGGAAPGWLSINSTTGVLSGTPTNDDVGAADVRVTATDNSGESASADFQLTVTNTNDDPVATDDVGEVDENAVLNLDALSGVLSNDTDVDVGDVLSVTTFDAVSVKGAAVNVNADGSFSYDPTGSATLQALLPGQSTTDTFNYTVSDGTASDIGTVTITVDGVGIVTTGDTGVPNVDADLIIGDVGVGTMDVADGSTVSSNSGVLGNQPTGDGTVTLDGAGTTWTVSTGNLTIGNRGTGDMTVSDGALVTIDSGITDPMVVGDFVDLVIGGSDQVANTGVGSLTITGAGSRVETIGIDNTIRIGLDGGTGTLLVEAGGEIETEFFEVGRVRGSSALDGGMATATVTGTGSTIIVSSEGGTFSVPYDYEAGFARVGRGTNLQAFLNILDGGRMEVREGATNNTTSTVPGLQIGRDGATGTVVVDGAGSVLAITQANPIGPPNFFGPDLQVGRGVDGVGFLTVSDGGRVELLGEEAFFAMGTRPEGVGTVTVTGAGSTFEATATLPGGGPVVGGGASIGSRENTTATFEVLDGAEATFTMGGFGLANRIGSDGTLLVDGAGSVLNTTVDFSGLGNQGTADITVSAGGVWNLASDAAMADAAGSTVTALVTGAGSQLNVTGEFFIVGQGNYNDNGTPGDPSDDYGVQGLAGTADLSIEAGGLLTSNTLSIGGENLGDGTKGVGTVTVDGAGSQIQLTSVVGSGGFPISHVVGHEGDGTLLITNGGVVTTVGASTIDSASNFEVASAAGSTGSVTVSGAGSRLDIGDQFFSLGNGGYFDNGTPGDPSDDFGVLGQTSTATVTIEDGGQVTAPSIDIGSGNDTDGNTGVGNVTVSGAGSSLVLTSVPGFDGSPTGHSIGSQGMGSLSILDGGLVQTVGLINGMGSSGTSIGTAAGASGTVLVSGLGSQLIIDDEFVGIGDGVFDDNGTPGDPSDDFGIEGELAHGTLRVEAGGVAQVQSIASGSQPDGHADIIVDGEGSLLDASDAIGVSAPAGGSATLTVSDGGVVRAATGVFVNEGGTVAGDGTIDGNLQLNDLGEASPGTSIGDLVVTGSFGVNGATLTMEVENPLLHDTISVGQNANLNDGIVHLLFTSAYAPVMSTGFEIVQAQGGAFGPASSISLAVTGLAEGAVMGPLDISGNSVTVTAQGSSGGDTTLFFGVDRDDTFSSGAGDDRFTGSGGDDTYDAGAGNDTAVLAGNRVDYTVTVNPGDVTVTDDVPGNGDEGTDVYTNVERFEFADVTLTVPTEITLDNPSVNENDAGAVIGTLTVSDEDDVSHGFAVSDARFEVDGSNQLKLVAGMSLDFETEPVVSVAVTATDGDGFSRTETFQVVVNDQAPGGVDDSGATFSDAVLNVAASGVLGNDVAAPTSGALTVSEVEGSAGNVGAALVLGSGATVTMLSDGSYSYDPSGLAALSQGEVFEDSFGYTVTDANGETDTATVSVVVTGAPSGTVQSGDVAGDIIVGDTGSGSLNIAGAVLSTNEGLIGNQTGSDGSVVVSQSGAQWNVGTGKLWVGNQGTGDLFVGGGAQVSVDNGLTDPLTEVGTFDDLVVGPFRWWGESWHRDADDNGSGLACRDVGSG